MSHTSVQKAEDRVRLAAEKLKREKARMEKVKQLERNKLAKKARSDDTRRKILAGAFLIQAADKLPATKDFMLKGLEEFLTRNDDRVLFKLNPK